VPGLGDSLGWLGGRAWRTLTNVRFAVLQIVVLAICGLIGTIVRQLPSFALRDPAAYVRELDDLHRRYDPVTLLGVNVGPGMVDLFERLGFFRIFTAPWFSTLLLLLIVSITVCTLDRTPRLWRTARLVRVAQPEAFFDLRLPERARLGPSRLAETDVAAVLRSQGFGVRAAESDGARHVYGDRHQYLKLATLLTHLGLILFLTGGFVTGAFGFEHVLAVAAGEAQPVQPVGTPHNLIAKNVSFEAPRRPDGSFEDFRTDLAVYRDGVEVARKQIRVNDPLTVDGFVFHQNTFGPAADITIRDPTGRLLWSGPMVLIDRPDVPPQGFMTIPGSATGLHVALAADTSGVSRLVVLGLPGEEPPAGEEVRPIFGEALTLGATSDPERTGGFEIAWRSMGAWTGIVIKKDPGQPIIWLAFGSLIAGLALSFYFPRRRAWVRLDPDGRARVAFLADRYVDTEREFGRLVEALAARARR
jgi:cytochrome c biogenesis protein